MEDMKLINALISCFQDTLRMCETPALKAETEEVKRSTVVYNENYFAKNRESRHHYEPPKSESQVIEILEGTTFAIAKKYCNGVNKVGVLNFANPHNPGGGVRNGAMAQEECLCRSSNLYPCLCTAEAIGRYYNYNKMETDHFFSDRVIYSEGVTVFKNDDIIPTPLLTEDWFKVSVITCAAPCLGEAAYMNRTALKEILRKRIKNIFEVALENRIDVLILGAFGCGAFKNPPEVVASVFHEVIRQGGYTQCFDKIIFAIKSTAGCNSHKPCPNLTAFMSEFQGALEKMHQSRISCFNFLHKSADFAKMPFGKELKGRKRKAYCEWRDKNPYNKKQFSILGDSISTLEGYNPQKYKAFYTIENSMISGVKEMNDTWWGKVIRFFGGELLVNNSWSGSRVAQLPDSGIVFPSACSDERTSTLHINSILPDVIIIYMGTNDWGFGTKHCKEGDTTADLKCFDTAYRSMLKKLKENYPAAEIWCCTLPASFISSDSSFVFPEILTGNDIKRYNRTIRDIADLMDCRLIDLYRYQCPYDSIDGTHPNVKGMEMLAELIIRSVITA